MTKRRQHLFFGVSFSFKSSCIKIQRKRKRITPCDVVSINRSIKNHEKRERERERERGNVYVDSKKVNTIVK